MNASILYVLILDKYYDVGYNEDMGNIEFFSTIEGILGSEECLPKPAKTFIPKWFKDISPSISGTVKQCPSFPDYFSQGYIVPMWTDTILKYDQNKDEWAWATPDDLTSWGTHNATQFLDYTDASLNGIGGKFVFKANCPWQIVTPPGWSVLQLPLFYHFNKEWSVLPGVIDTDIHHEINQQVLYHSDSTSIEIKKGTPFAMYVPFKRDNKLDLVIRKQTEEDKNKIQEINFRYRTSFRPNGIYRAMQRKRDKNV